MVKAMVNHVEANHPDLAKQMEAMHAKDPHAWGKETKPKWRRPRRHDALCAQGVSLQNICYQTRNHPELKAGCPRFAKLTSVRRCRFQLLIRQAECNDVRTDGDGHILFVVEHVRHG